MRAWRTLKKCYWRLRKGNLGYVMVKILVRWLLVIIRKIDSVPNRVVYLHGYISTQCIENTNWFLHASYEKTREDKYKLEKKMFTFQWEYGWHISNSRCGSNLNYLIPYALHIEKEVQTKKEGGPQGKYKFYGTSRSRCKNPKGIIVRHSIKNLERFKAVLHSSSQLYKRYPKGFMNIGHGPGLSRHKIETSSHLRSFTAEGSKNQKDLQEKDQI